MQYIVKGINGRWNIVKRELTCGSCVQLYDENLRRWVDGRIEHNGQEYCFCGVDNKNRKLHDDTEIREVEQ